MFRALRNMVSKQVVSMPARSATGTARAVVERGASRRVDNDTRRESMLEEAPRRATDARAGRRATAETAAVARETRGAHAWAMAMCDDVV